MTSKITLHDYKLPTSADGLDGLLQFGDIFGSAETLEFLSIGYGSKSPMAVARQIFAARLVADHMKRNPETTYNQARVAVGREQGYPGVRQSNFQRMSDPGRELLRARGEWPFDPSRDA